MLTGCDIFSSETTEPGTIEEFEPRAKASAPSDTLSVMTMHIDTGAGASQEIRDEWNLDSRAVMADRIRYYKDYLECPRCSYQGLS